jgi:hypothetical protein
MMGFFKSMRELQKEAKDIERTAPPVKDRMAEATARMSAATQSMASQTQAINQSFSAEGGGIEATATINAARTAGMVNFDPLMDLDLTVMRDGMPPYPANVRQVVPQVNLARLQSGTSVGVKVDPNDPNAIWVDLTKIQ